MLLANKLRWRYQHRLPSPSKLRALARTWIEAALLLTILFSAWTIVAHNDANAAPTPAQERRAAEKAQKRAVAREQRREREVRYEACVAQCMNDCRA